MRDFPPIMDSSLNPSRTTQVYKCVVHEIHVVCDPSIQIPLAHIVQLVSEPDLNLRWPIVYTLFAEEELFQYLISTLPP